RLPIHDRLAAYQVSGSVVVQVGFRTGSGQRNCHRIAGMGRPSVRRGVGRTVGPRSSFGKGRIVRMNGRRPGRISTVPGIAKEAGFNGPQSAWMTQAIGPPLTSTWAGGIVKDAGVGPLLTL